MLTDIRQLKHIINSSHPEDDVILATLAGDTTDMSSNGGTSDNLYCLQVLPLDPKHKTTPFCFHIFFQKALYQDPYSIFSNKIKEKLKNRKSKNNILCN